MELTKLISIVVILVAISCFSWLEYHRSNRKRLGLRVAATVLSFVSIYLLLFPVSWAGRKTGGGSGVGIILTEGFSPDTLQSIREKNKNAVVVEGTELFNAPANLSDFYLLGYGFRVGTRFSDMPANILFHPTQQSQGFTAVYWKQSLTPGEELRVYGRYDNPAPTEVILKLSAFSLTEDSTTIPANSSHDFILRSVPRFTGRAVYKLSALSGTDTIEYNQVPLKVENSQRPSIMMLSSSPGFEQRFFQDWLFEQGFSVISRVRTSKDKIERKFLNIPKQLQQQSLTAQLKSADILICDSEEFNRLGAAEKQSILGNVAENGSGILIAADSVLPRNDLLRKSFFLSGFSKISNSIKLKRSENKNPISVPVDGQLHFIKPSENISPVITDSAERIIVGTVKFGKGNITVSLMPSLYPLSLSGKHYAFAELWTSVISSLSSKHNRRDRIGVDTRFPVVDEELNFTLISVNDQEKKISAGDVHLALRQDADLAVFYKGKYWPRKEGWLDEVRSSSDTTSVFIYGDADWKTIRMKERIDYTKELIKNNANKKAIAASENRQRKKIPALFLYLMLILSTVFLWIEKKFA